MPTPPPLPPPLPPPSPPPSQSADAPAAGSAAPSTPPVRPWRGGLREYFDLPYSRWWPLVAGVASGIALRLVFMGDPGQVLNAMSGAFIYLAPVLVGAVTVYVAERRERHSWGYYFLASFAANLLFILGTLLIMVEGLICAILIFPLFATLGGLGGMLMGAVCRITRWPKQTLYSFSVLPLLLGLLEPQVPLPDRIGRVERSVLVQASPEQVWAQVWNVRDIRPRELDSAWMYRIGVPLPRSGLTRTRADGALVRGITMGKGIRFDQVVAELEPGRHVRWTYDFGPDAFPPRALDDHVRIGGQYFDLRGTSYSLAPEGDATRLTVRMEYRVSTRFNWYAQPLAQWLMGDFGDRVLHLYRARSEATVAPSPQAASHDHRTADLVLAAATP